MYIVVVGENFCDYNLYKLPKKMVMFPHYYETYSQVELLEEIYHLTLEDVDSNYKIHKEMENSPKHHTGLIQSRNENGQVKKLILDPVYSKL